MTATPGTVVTSSTPNDNTNTSLTVALASTTPGDLNVVEISGYASGTTINPGMSTPAGWVKLLERIDSNGTPASFVAVYYRIFQAGDPSTVTVTWTKPGQMVAVATPWTGFDPAAPIPWSTSDFKVASDANYSITGTPTAAGILAYGFANRTGAAWSSLSDNPRGQIGLSSSSTMTCRATAAEVASGFTKTAVGSNTSVGVSWAYTVKAASEVIPGTAALTGSGALTVEAEAVLANAVALSGVGTLTADGGPSTSGAVALSGSGTLTASAQTLVERWLTLAPFYCAHRGGSADWPEETMYAYGKAAAWNPDLALEVSAWRSSDGVWVASHDQTTGRVFGTNYDIPTTAWATLSSLTTTAGGYPICRLVDVLSTYGATRVIFVDNKSGANNAEFLDLVDTYCGPGRAVVKMYYTAVSLVPAAHARGYKTWGYYYDADVTKSAPNLASTQANYDLLGMDYLASSASWTAVKSYGKPVLGHIIDSASAKSTALGFGADGLMVSKVTTVVPQTGYAGAVALSGVGTLTAVGAAPSPLVSVWNGTSEKTATVTVWDGATEHAAAAIEITA